MNGIDRYWTADDKRALDTATEYRDLCAIARRIIARIPKPVVQVCGPISSGGYGSEEKNLSHLAHEIHHAVEAGAHVFNQVPFQTRMHRIRDARAIDGYDHAILTDFYQPLFEAGLIQQLWFLPQWESSIGSRWEHEQGECLGLEMRHL